MSEGKYAEDNWLQTKKCKKKNLKGRKDDYKYKIYIKWLNFKKINKIMKKIMKKNNEIS